MSDKIKLTPAMLIQQGAQLKSVSDSYKTTVRDVEKVLNSINGNWSKNLANNFSGKITETTKVTNALTDTLDKTVSLIDNVGNQFESFDHALAQMVGGLSNASTASAAAMTYNCGETKQKTSNNPFEGMYEAYDALPKERQEAIDIVLKYLMADAGFFGDKNQKVLKTLLKLAAHKGEWKDAWILGDLAIGVLDKSVDKKLGLSPLGVAYAAVKTYLSGNYIQRSFDNVTASYNALKEGDIAKAMIQYLGNNLMEYEKLKVDTLCKLVDKSLFLSEINTVVKIICKKDFGKAFNSFTGVISQMADAQVSGELFTQKGFSKYVTMLESVFDKKNFQLD